MSITNGLEQGGRNESKYITQYCQYTVLKTDYQNGLYTHSKVFQTKEMMSLFWFENAKMHWLLHTVMEGFATVTRDSTQNMPKL